LVFKNLDTEGRMSKEGTTTSRHDEQGCIPKA
jgi:hypothetical protein